MNETENKLDLMYYPNGRCCCLCFKGFDKKDLEPISDEPGKVWDVCKECAANEKALGAKY